MRFINILFIIIMGLWLVPQVILAQDDFNFNEHEEDKKPGIPISGQVSLEGARQLDNPDQWILAGLSLNLIFDYYHSGLGQLFFEGFGRFNLSYKIEDDSKRTKDKYKLEGIFREFFWKNNFDRFTLSAGKIIDDKSIMDMFQIFDKNIVINRANDFFADPEEVRFGQNMVKLDYFSGNDAYAGLMFSPYPAFDRVTDFDHPYSIVPNKILDKQDSEREMEGSLYVSRTLPKGLVSGYFGRFNNRMPILEAQASSPERVLGIYKTYWSLGGAFNAALEPFLLKAEAVYNFNKPLQTRFQNRPTGYIRYDELEFALGVDYNGGDYGLFIVEFSVASPLENDDMLAKNRWRYFGALSWSNNYYNDKLKLRNVTYFPESFKNHINLFQVDYYITDNFSITAKYTRFDINKRTNDYGYMNDYDRIDFSLNYHFDLD